MHPAGELSAVAAHVHQHAASPLGVREPVRMGLGMLLGLADEIHTAERSLIGELFGPDIDQREAAGSTIESG